MSYSIDMNVEESYSSFLAGVLLLNREINILEFEKLINQFQFEFNVSITECDYLKLSILTTKNCICLVEDYDDIIKYKNKKMTVRKYLYLMTTNKVREFFHLDIDIKKSFDLGFAGKSRTLKRKTI